MNVTLRQVDIYIFLLFSIGSSRYVEYHVDSHARSVSECMCRTGACAGNKVLS